MRWWAPFIAAFLFHVSAIPASAAPCEGPGSASPGTVCDTAAFGGNGGSRFRDACPAGHYLRGIEVNAGSYVDSVSARCAPFNGPNDGTADVALGRHGGAGGSYYPASCREPFSTIAVSVAVEDGLRRFVRHIQLVCRNENVCAGFGGKQCLAEAEDAFFGQTCPQDMVATGIHGFSGSFVDRFGIICDRPPLAANVEIIMPVPGDVTAPDVGIIEQPLPGDITRFATPSLTGTWDSITGDGIRYTVFLDDQGNGSVGAVDPNLGGTISGSLSPDGRTLSFVLTQPAVGLTSRGQLSLSDRNAFEGRITRDSDGVPQAWTGQRRQ